MRSASLILCSVSATMSRFSFFRFIDRISRRNGKCLTFGCYIDTFWMLPLCDLLCLNGIELNTTQVETLDFWLLKKDPHKKVHHFHLKGSDHLHSNPTQYLLPYQLCLLIGPLAETGSIVSVLGFHFELLLEGRSTHLLLDYAKLNTTPKQTLNE